MSSAHMQLWTHYDIMDNILCHLHGRKRVLLWRPEDARYLYMEESSSRVVDVDNPNLEQYPLFPLAQQHECFLNSGDVLFIPALWLHNVTALQPSLSVNVFWKNLPHELYANHDLYGNRDLVVAEQV